MKIQDTVSSFLLLLFTINGLIAQQFLDKTLIYDGQIRQYKIYLPANYDGSTSFPLLFNFHGGGGDIASQIAIADMRSIADTSNFIIVYPQALPDPNDGGSTNWLHKDPTDVDDVFFVEVMIDTIASMYELDHQRIYACGYSLGGEFTYELACRLNDRISAIGVVARTMGTAAFNNCSPSHPTGILTILGTEDGISPYDGLTWNGIQYYLSADEMHNYWITHNNTSTQPIISQLPNQNQSDGSIVESYIWENGNRCVSVRHLKVIGGGHDWPGAFGNMDIDASLEIWNYVSKFNLNGRIDCGISSTNGEIEKAKNIIIYPNPVTKYLTIDKHVDSEQAYKIYSADGKLILSGKVNSKIETINLSTLPPNNYILIIENIGLKFFKSE